MPTICLHQFLLKMIGINIRVMMVPWSILILYNSIFHWTLFSNKPSLNAWMNLPWMFLLSFPDVNTFCPILHFSINLLLNKLSFNLLHWYFCYHLWEELWLTLIYDINEKWDLLNVISAQQRLFTKNTCLLNSLWYRN